jgi:2-amino-4-hydroxy-6-hydroxymethyldihydropteridine diphosphokinase
MLAQVETACIALGSNLGNREQTLRAAIEQIRHVPQTTLTAVSSFFETKPVDGTPGSGLFLNAAAVVQTGLSADALMKALLDIERSLGRDRSGAQPKNAPRPIDLDLLLYGQLITSSSELIIPHPRMHLRRFVLEPLAQIAPDIVHPQYQRTVGELLALLPPGDA